ncbi:hypothetical protein TNCV_1587151 [Trichonephila clavipes]|nr:hypothetical protein TNCV_1587151 [Trichonephila clavipes]
MSKSYFPKGIFIHVLEKDGWTKTMEIVDKKRLAKASSCFEKSRQFFLVWDMFRSHITDNTKNRGQHRQHAYNVHHIIPPPPPRKLKSYYFALKVQKKRGKGKFSYPLFLLEICASDLHLSQQGAESEISSYSCGLTRHFSVIRFLLFLPVIPFFNRITKTRYLRVTKLKEL